MKPFLKAAIVILFFLTAGDALFSQTTNNLCANATPFCTGQTMNFPAGVNAGVAQSGPSYGCLGSEPNPAWFFMQIANSGSMSIAMSAPNDIDFICWGPFPSLSGACGSLTASNIQSCSYSSSATETCTIANAVPGQFYLMLITNYSNQVQNITFNQNNAGNPGAASTNCGFVCVVAAAATPSLMCAGQSATVTLTAGTSSAVNSYTWSGPSSFSSTLPSNVIPNLQSTSIYTVVGTSSAIINGALYSGTCQAAVTVSVIPYPSYTITPTTTNICQGGSFNAGITFTVPSTPSNFYYHWYSPSSSGILWQPFVQNTLITPPLAPTGVLSSTYIYSVTVTPSNTQISCPVTKTLAVTINNPSNPTITAPPHVCDISTPFQLTASPPGGIWGGNPAVTAGGLFTPSLVTAPSTVAVNYTTSVGNCTVSNTQTVSISKYYSAALTTPSLNTQCALSSPFNLMNVAQNTLTGKWSGTQVTNNHFNPGGLPTGNYTLAYSTGSFPDSLVCPASTILIVPVFNPPTPTISAINPTCTNGGTVTLSASPPGGVWSGAAGVSPTGIQTPSLNAIGSNTVVYSAGLGTCVASNSAVFHVSQFNTAALSGVIPNLCVSSNPVNLMSIVQNTTGIWSGFGTSGNFFNPGNLPTNTYTLTYQTLSNPNTSLCPDTRTLTVSVLNPPTPVIKPVGPVCSTGSPIQLTVTPAVGNWVTTSYISASGIFSPGVSPIGNNAVQYVIGTNTCHTQQVLMISTEAFVPASIISKLPDLCTSGGQMDLNPYTANDLGHWSGPGIVGSYFNPILSGTGSFTIKYQTSSIPSGLCPDAASIAVNVFSLATPVISAAGPFCDKSLPVQLQVTPVGGVFSGGLAHAVSSGGLFNPAMALIGDNIVTYSVSSGPCIANAIQHISVEKFISADFINTGNSIYCVTDQPFNLNGLVQNPGGNFSGPGVVDIMFDPSKANLGVNTVTYQTLVSLCPDTKTLSINVKAVPNVSAESSVYSGCAPLEVVLKSSASATGLSQWNFGDGSISQGNANSSHIYNSPGSYTVVFSYADAEAKSCAAEVTVKEIKVFESPKADFAIYPDEITIANPEVELKNLSTTLQNNRYTWTIDGLNQRYEVSPLVYFPTIGSYKITLTATTVNGCKDEKTQIVNVKNEFDVFIPNSFTPNYDGLNDVFKPVFSFYGLDTKNYSLEIFDRWGHQLFSSKDYDKGWDGTVQNKGEEPLKEDTYVYKLNYKDLNGQTYQKIGDVTLIK